MSDREEYICEGWSLAGDLHCAWCHRLLSEHPVKRFTVDPAKVTIRFRVRCCMAKVRIP